MKSTLVIALICSGWLAGGFEGYSWKMDHDKLDQTINRQAQAIQDQNLCLTTIETAFRGITVEKYFSNQTNLFPPPWEHVKDQPYYLNASYAIRAKIVGAWINQNAIAYADVCSKLAARDEKTADLLEKSADATQRVIDYAKLLETKNEQLNKQLAQSQVGTQTALAELNQKLDQNKEALDLMVIQNKDAAQKAEIDATIKSAPVGTSNPYYVAPVTDYANSILNEYLKDPYHDCTIITPDGITQATVIDNN